MKHKVKNIHFVGVGGAVSVGNVNNDVGATIQAGAKVAARRDVEVSAVAIKDLEGYTVSAAGGLVGVQGAISVWSLGTPISKNYTDAQGRSYNAMRGDNGATTRRTGSGNRFRKTRGHARSRRSR